MALIFLVADMPTLTDLQPHVVSFWNHQPNRRSKYRKFQGHLKHLHIGCFSIPAFDWPPKGSKKYISIDMRPTKCQCPNGSTLSSAIIFEASFWGSSRRVFRWRVATGGVGSTSTSYCDINKYIYTYIMIYIKYYKVTSMFVFSVCSSTPSSLVTYKFV